MRRSDQHAVDRVGFYAGRYGNLATFELDEFLGNLAGSGPVDLPEERRRAHELLLGGA
jgi:hypothetical protein